MSQLSPYLHFDGTCKEAMEFYKDCLGGELFLMTVDQSGMADQIPDMPGVKPDKIMHSALKKDGWVLMAADMMDPGSFKKGDTVSVCLMCTSKGEIEDLYQKLSEGGDIFMKLEKQSFGWFAQFSDKFGTEWMLQFEGKRLLPSQRIITA